MENGESLEVVFGFFGVEFVLQVVFNFKIGRIRL